MLESLGIEEAAEPPAWFQTLTNLILYGVLLLFLVFGLRMLYVLCCRMMQSFAAGDPGDELIFPDNEGEEEQGPGRRGRGGFRSTPASAVRRKYRKLIWQRARTGITGTETPEELEGKAGLRGAPQPENGSHVSGEDASVTYLHAIYEKARYSREGCTRDEAKKFKNYWITHSLPESVKVTEDR